MDTLSLAFTTQTNACAGPTDAKSAGGVSCACTKLVAKAAFVATLVAVTRAAVRVDVEVAAGRSRGRGSRARWRHHHRRHPTPAIVIASASPTTAPRPPWAPPSLCSRERGRHSANSCILSCAIAPPTGARPSEGRDSSAIACVSARRAPQGARPRARTHIAHRVPTPGTPGRPRTACVARNGEARRASW
eukprot:362705-Chlamydomonas_euryale.AAC.10